jgi:hypothetical protein
MFKHAVNMSMIWGDTSIAILHRILIFGLPMLNNAGFRS